MVKDGNTVAPIYDVDGTALGNPIITDIYGRTLHQVCIDEDVVAYFYKYVGNGIWSSELDIDTSDTSKWALQYTSESDLYVDINNEGRSSFAVMNIEELRDLNANDVMSIDGVKIVTLMGYNEAGDKEPINYIWNTESTEPDDGGAVIATDLIKGRWIMVCPTEHLDVRHYGVFPSDSQNMLDQTLAIQYALVYANNHGLRLFFDTLTNTQYYHYYKITNITLNPVNQIDLAKGVIFIDDDVTIHSQQTNAFRNDPYFLNGDTTLYSNYAKSSWNIKALSKSKLNEEATYIIDDNAHSTSVNTLQGWNVDVEQNITGYTFTQCNVYGSGLITSTTFTTCQLNMNGTVGDYCNFANCKLNEYIFNGSPSIGTVTNCIFDIDDFVHKVNLWNVIYIDQYSEPNIDFKNVTIPTDFGVYGQYNSDRTYSNFIGTSSTGHEFGDGMGDYTYTFKNVSGNIVLDGNGNNTYVFENSNVKLTFNIYGYRYNIIIKDSTVVIDEDLPNATIIANSSNVTLKNYYDTVSIKDSSLFGDVANRRLICSNFSAYSSIVNQEVSAPNILYKDSQINKDIYSTNDGTSIITYIDNSIWNDIQQHISSNTANTIINGVWTNNNATKVNPIDLDMTNLINDDSQHNYTYENNTGTFLPKNAHISYQQYGCFAIYYNVWNATIVSRPELYNVPHLITGNNAFPITDGSNRANWSYGIYIPENWQPDCKFFSIGLASRRINLTIKIPFRHAKLLDNTSWYNDVTGWNPPLTYTYSDSLTATNIDGATHKLTEFKERMLIGPQYVPYSYDEPAFVPYDSTVIPPTGADNYYFNIEIETF
ncbi:MAG: hypothetical protein IKG84_06895 [Bacteroidales bacterium]|nr:hypothetical protein [Bacteroidales bacterium]